jgi:glycosyltransferase involved in cell wall biosynthesis
MRFAVFTHVPHYLEGNNKFAYAPYVREMDLWFELTNDVELVAPIETNLSKKDQAYKRKDILFSPIPSISFLGIRDTIISVIKIPVIVFKILRAMLKADHLHIRCPGNIGMLSCLLQILFPRKPKTFKYAGNWDPSSNQPWTYRFQKYLISNEKLTKNAKVLVYGEWRGMTANILSFFTASYHSKEILEFKKEFSAPFRFLFVGSLTAGKRPLLAIQIIEYLRNLGKDVYLDLYGSGNEVEELVKYIDNQKLGSFVSLHGDKKHSTIKDAYQKAHFSLLPSKSEGWPKAIAEAMFFGCIPIATEISCLPWMMDKGKRGILIEPDVIIAAQTIGDIMDDQIRMERISKAAMNWSQRFTLDHFQAEIKKLL